MCRGSRGAASRTMSTCAASPATTLPFALHEWHLTWCRHFLGCDPRIRGRAAFLLIAQCGGRLCRDPAVHPQPPPARAVQNRLDQPAWAPIPAITEIRAPMIERGYEHLTARAVRDGLAKVARLGLDSLERGERASLPRRWAASGTVTGSRRCRISCSTCRRAGRSFDRASSATSVSPCGIATTR